MKLPSMISATRHRINTYLTRRLSEIGCPGLVPSHGEILFRLFNDGALTMSQMAKAIKRDPSTLTTLINKLKKLGFVELVENKNDLRSKLITLTEKGEEFEKDFADISVDLNKTLTKGLSEAEEKELIRLLGITLNNIQ